MTGAISGMGNPFLIGEAMRGGYGAADILNGCTIAVDKGEIAVTCEFCSTTYRFEASEVLAD